MTEALVVGAGLGGLRAAESLRSAGFSGDITIVGDEPHPPYNRPPLSKEALSEGIEFDRLAFRQKESVQDARWRLGFGAVASDLAGRTVTLADGTVLGFDGLVIATGIRPRALPIPGPSAGRFMLRTVADAQALRDHLKPGTTLLIMGAGFIGCEVAATAVKLGASVHIVALDAQPMVRPLGEDLGAAMRRRHEEHGVQFHLGRTVTRFLGDDTITGAELDDGTVLAADLVLEAVGSVPNTDWLDGNGLDLRDGVLVDSNMQLDSNEVVSTSHDVVSMDSAAIGAPAPIVAVGDLARFPHALFGSTPRRIEHWNMPTETGRRAGKTLAALLAGEECPRQPFDAMPAFWSDQYHHKLQSFGMPGLAERIEIVSGTVDGDCIVEYHDATGLVGVVGINRTSDLAPYRKRLMERAQ